MEEAHKRKIFCPETQQNKNGLKPAKFEDFFKFANFFYATMGLQPYNKLEVSKRKTLLYNLIFYFSFINLNIIMVGEITFVVMSFVQGDNFVVAILVTSYIGFVTVGNCKVLFVLLQKSALTRLINDLKEMFPQDIESQKRYNLQTYLRQCTHITMGFSILYMVLIWTYNLISIVQYIVGNRLLGMADIEQTLPFIVYIPWNWHQHWSYYILYALEDLGGFTSAVAQISSDLFLVSCVTQIIMHFDYVSQEITKFQAGSGKTTEKDVKFLGHFISYHVKLLDLSERINQIFGIPLLLNFGSSVFIICFVGFNITIGATPETMFKLSLFLFSSGAQAYMICHFGQQLKEVSLNVASAVYNQDWFWADVRYQKMLVLIAQRAQDPVQLRATIFVQVSLTTMTELMQMSYKFFALLRTMYADE